MALFGRYGICNWCKIYINLELKSKKDIYMNEWNVWRRYIGMKIINTYTNRPRFCDLYRLRVEEE